MCVVGYAGELISLAKFMMYVADTHPRGLSSLDRKQAVSFVEVALHVIYKTNIKLAKKEKRELKKKS